MPKTIARPNVIDMLLNKESLIKNLNILDQKGRRVMYDRNYIFL